MKNLTALLTILVVSFTSVNASAEWENDKTRHATLSFVISSGLYATFRYHGHGPIPSSLAAIAGTMFFGMAKELADPDIDDADLKADLLGAVVAPIIFINF